MLFDKHIEPLCAYCARFYALGEDHGICEKRGPVSPDGHCRAFRYDPTSRIPPAAPGEDELPVYENPDNTDDKEITP